MTPPGATIQDLLDEQCVMPEALAHTLGLDSLDALLDGTLPLTEEIAQKLAEVFDVSVEFWVTREALYRKALAKS